jgi:hypothetical protein
LTLLIRKSSLFPYFVQAYLKSAVGLINQDEDEFVYARSERQPGDSLTSMKGKVKQRHSQLMRM